MSVFVSLKIATQQLNRHVINYFSPYVDVVGILQEFHPVSKLTNKYRQEIPVIEFTITDMLLVLPFLISYVVKLLSS